MALRIVALCVSIAVVGEAIAQDTDAAGAKPDRLQLSVTLEPNRATTLFNQVEGRSRIQSILPEGTLVKSGEVVCSINVAAQHDRAAAIRLELERTRAEIAKSKAVLAVTQRKTAALQLSASRRVRVAQMALKSWTDGESPLRQAELEGSVRICSAQLEYAKGVVAAAEIVESPIEKLRMRIETTRAEVNLQNAELRLKYHREFLHGQRIDQLQLEIEEASMGADMSSAEADAAEASQVADLAAKSQQLKSQQQQLDRALAQLQLATIRAPHQGVVVYVDPSSRRANVFQAGQEVRERQAIVNVQDLSRMRADIDPNTATELEPGQRISVQVDAFPNQLFSGTLAKSLDEKDSAEHPPKAWILIEHIKGLTLLPGMTAVVNIELNR